MKTKFEKDLQDGQRGEQVIANYILNKRKKLGLAEYRNDNEFDFRLTGETTQITFEIKTDRYEYLKKVETGNMFIEISCYGKASGISVTKADYFVYFFPDLQEAYMCKTADLRLFLIKNNVSITEQCGDGGRVEGVLIKRSIAKQNKIFSVLKIKKDEKIWNN